MGRKPGKYSVYDGRTTLPVIVYATREQAMRVMGISTVDSFKSACYASRQGKLKKWEIIKEVED